MTFWTNNFFTQHITPGRYCAVIEKRILKEYEAIGKIDKCNVPQGDKKNILEKIEKDIEQQLDRKKGLEEKIKAILFSITIAITAITFVLDHDMNMMKTAMGVITIVILLLSIFYFISSAIVAVKALFPIGFGSVHEDVTFDKKKHEITLTIHDNEVRLKQLLKISLLNDNVNLRVANATYASLKLLRNGIILFAIYFALALVQKPSHSKTEPSNNPYRYALNVLVKTQP